ncbi:MAG: 2-octaprenyl-6-methoxyphenyl hydroxylase, partial [Hyphomicrobiaceae bacterium]|nr:2-octaprenyl-6-methoxyphenyl hydroxylase [Hyphomicrobiaceae bacterium]
MSPVKRTPVSGGGPADRDREAYDVVIVGGGAIGVALACALADGLAPAGRIALVDPLVSNAAPAEPDARASAVSAGSKRLLDVLGAWRTLAPHAEPVTAVDITDSALGDAFRPILVSYDNTVERGEPATYIVENERLRAALLEALAGRSGIALIAGTAEAWHAAEGGGAIVLAD